MAGKEHIPSTEFEEAEFFTLGALARGGLPADLGNDAYGVDLALSLYKKVNILKKN